MPISDVEIDYVDGEIKVFPDPVQCKVPKPAERGANEPPPVKIRWKARSEERVKDWRVIFGTYAPVHDKSKVANPKKDTLTLVRRRPEDLGHWKYVVVADTPDGIKDKDPELIVDDD